MIWAAAFTALAFAGVSAAASVILWISFADTTLDKFLYTIAALASLAAMYLFASASRDQHYSKGLRTGMSAIAAVLFISSIAATIGWLESRYQSTHKTELSSDSNHTLLRQQIADLSTDITNLQDSVAADIKGRYRNRASKNQIKIDRKTAEREALRQQLNNNQVRHNANASQALASGLNQWRWALWLLMAIIIDATPILCLRAIAQQLQQNQADNSATVTTNETAPATAPETLQQPARKPALTLAATDATPAKTTASETVTEHPATDAVQQLILNGEKPSSRQFMGREIAGKKLRHADIKPIFKTLTARGIIRPEGQGYVVVENVIQNRNAGATA